MSTNNICLCKEVEGNILAVILLDCALIGVCAVIRSNTVVIGIAIKSYLHVCFVYLLTVMENKILQQFF